MQDAARAESGTATDASTQAQKFKVLRAVARSKRLEAQASFRDIDPSMWDVALVLGTEPVGAGASAFAALLLALNCVVQALFLYILILPDAALTTSSWDDGSVAQLATWRSTVASWLQRRTEVTST